MTTLAQLHLDHARERQEPNLYLDKKLKQQLRAFVDLKEKINKENRRYRQPGLGTALTDERVCKTISLDTSKIHAADFDCDCSGIIRT